MRLIATVTATANVPHPMMLTVSDVVAMRVMPSAAIASGARNRRVAARRRCRRSTSSLPDPTAASRESRGSIRIATPTTTRATSGATRNPTMGPPSRKPAMIGTVIAAGNAKSIHGCVSAGRCAFTSSPLLLPVPRVRRSMNASNTNPEARAGAWFHDPATGEISRLNVGPAVTDGRRLEVDLWLQPGAAVVGAHVHDHFIERFEVIDGEVGFQVAGDERVARPGGGAVEVPAGTVHDWWNAGKGVAHVRVEVQATPEAPGR